MIVGGIVQFFLALYGDCRWNCAFLELFIVIVGGIVQFFSSLW